MQPHSMPQHPPPPIDTFSLESHTQANTDEQTSRLCLLLVIKTLSNLIGTLHTHHTFFLCYSRQPSSRHEIELSTTTLQIPIIPPLSPLFSFHFFFLYRLSMTPTNSPLNYLDSTQHSVLSFSRIFAGDYLPIHYSIPPIHIGTLMRQDDRFFTPLAILRKTSRHQLPTTTTTTFLNRAHKTLEYIAPQPLYSSTYPLLPIANDSYTPTTTKINGLYLTYLWVIDTFIRCSYSRRVQPRRSCS